MLYYLSQNWYLFTRRVVINGLWLDVQNIVSHQDQSGFGLGVVTLGALAVVPQVDGGEAVACTIVQGQTDLVSCGIQLSWCEPCKKEKRFCLAVVDTLQQYRLEHRQLQTVVFSQVDEGEAQIWFAVQVPTDLLSCQIQVSWCKQWEKRGKDILIRAANMSATLCLDNCSSGGLMGSGDMSYLPGSNWSGKLPDPDELMQMMREKGGKR